MKRIFSSATKTVFLLIAITLCISFFFWLINGDQFIWIVGMVFAFYYKWNKNSTTTSTSGDSTNV